MAYIARAYEVMAHTVMAYIGVAVGFPHCSTARLRWVMMPQERSVAWAQALGAILPAILLCP